MVLEVEGADTWLRWSLSRSRNHCCEDDEVLEQNEHQHILKKEKIH